MRKLMIAFGIAALLTSSLAIRAGSLSVPNTFSSGTAISSSQMNAKFDEVEAQVTDNATRISALEGSASSCPSDMARVGPVCVDIYESSVWTTPGTGTGGTQLLDRDELVAAGCEVNGNGCANVVFARSIPGVMPLNAVTWFQAQQACASSGKRLLTNAEWQMAAAGTPDPNPGGVAVDPNTTCNVLSATDEPVPTGTAGANCESAYGVRDMVGNLGEWVADWVVGNGPAVTAGGFPSGTHGVTHGRDRSRTAGTGQSGADNSKFPAAIFRGGAFRGDDDAGIFFINMLAQPSRAPAVDPNNLDTIGFRCAI